VKGRRVVDLAAVRAACARLDALARTHPELLTDDARGRLAAALDEMEDGDGDENENHDDDTEADRTPTDRT
jgi:hypothetical protein